MQVPNDRRLKLMTLLKKVAITVRLYGSGFGSKKFRF